MPALTPRRRRAGVLVALAVIAAAIGVTVTVARGHVAAAQASAPSAPHALRADTTALEGAPTRSDLAALAALSTDVSGDVRYRRAGLDPFLAIGFSWIGPGELDVQVRLQMADGHWTPWTALAQDDAHSEDTAPSTRRYSDAIATGDPAIGFELLAPPDLGDLQLHVIREDPTRMQPLDHVAALSTSAAADGIPGPPGIRPRSAWGARPRDLTGTCQAGAHPEGLGCVADNGVVHAVIHHTVNPNDYSPAAVPTMLRSIQAYHIDVRGFDDIGYNFVVDRFGTVWEARAGGVDRPVTGGHTMGFNVGSVGVAVLGTYDKAAPTDASLEGVASIVAWKFAQRNVDPFGTTAVTSLGGDIYPEGQVVNVDNIGGHRDLGATSCPGALLYSRLPSIRQRVAELMPTFTGELTGMQRFSGQMKLSGFAFRRDTASPVGVALTVDGQTVATATADLARSDMATRLGPLGANHGFEFTLPVSLSARLACIIEQSSGTLIGCREINPVTPPFGDFSAAIAHTDPPSIDVGGWAIDPDLSEPSPVHVYVDGAFNSVVWATLPRSDLAARYSRYGTNHGFQTTIATSLGVHQVCVFAINVPAGGHPLLGCRIVAVGHVETTAPQGAIDVVQPQRGGVTVAGWAFDADSIDPIYVHVYVDGVHPPTVLLANVSRPDVAGVYPIAGGTRGYSAFVPTSPGTHDVCIYAIDDNMTGPHTFLGCRRVDVAVPDLAPPVGALDVAAPAGQAITIAGWAADPDTSQPIPVHAYVDGVLTTLWADQPRPDVATVFPAFGSERGFQLSIAAAPGTHNVCVYAINNNLIGPHTLLGCRSVNVPLPHGTAPIGALDAVTFGGGQVTVAGWAIDPDTVDAIAVHVYVGAAGTPIVADGDRPDVGAAFPAFGPGHGFRVTVPGGSGATVCVYAINDNPAAANTTLGCRSLR